MKNVQSTEKTPDETGLMQARFPWMLTLGRHITIEYHDSDPAVLNNVEYLQAAFLEAARVSQATIINSFFHAFAPQGVSGVIVIAESHISVHTWPEHDYAAVDMFTCSDDVDLQKGIDFLQAALKSKTVLISADMHRGDVTMGSVERTCPNQVASAHPFPLNWQKLYTEQQAHGISIITDIHVCNPHMLSNRDTIQTFLVDLCRHIQVAPVGESTILRNGEDFRVIQPTDTATISGHFIPSSQVIYLDISTTGYQDARSIADFALAYFEASYYRIQVALRR